jgi:protein BUR2
MPTFQNISAGHGRTPSTFEKSKDPIDVLAETEQQWLYTEEELLWSPSIVEGMPPEEERILRSKGVNFIIQVGIMLKLPQTTISTAAVFFNRFVMRHSLVPREGYKPLHHYVSIHRPGLILHDGSS